MADPARLLDTALDVVRNMPSLSGFGGSQSLLVKNIDEISRRWKLQRDYMFEFIIPHDIGGVPGNEVSKYCQRVRFGQYGLADLKTLVYGAVTHGFAGPLQIPPLTATYLAPVPDLVGAFFTQWRNLIVDEKGFGKPKQEYAKSGIVVLYDTTGQTSSIYQVSGLFPKTFPAFDLDYKNEGVVAYEIEFNVDRIIQEE